MKSIMPAQQHFATTPQIGNIQRSVFDRSKGHKTTFDSDWLIPFFLDEILPGDTMQVNTSMFARLATPLKPIMDNIHLDTFYFFVPNRIIWDNWEAFNGQNDNPLDTPIDYEIPQILFTAIAATGSIWDYFGIQVGVHNGSNPLEISALPARAYTKCINDWFRDENLQNLVNHHTGDGPDNQNDYNIVRRNKKHDYFTSCLPWPQKGDPVVLGPQQNVGVIGDGSTLGFYDDNGGFAGTYQFGTNALNTAQGSNNASVGDAVTGSANLQTGTVVGVSQNPNDSGLIALTSQLAAIEINDLRTAVAIQQVLEQDARGGTRYTEYIKSHFGVSVPDFRLQRAEYLGGSSTLMGVNTVPQSSPSGIQGSGGDLTAQGNLAAFITANDSNGFTKSFVEHGYVIGMVNVRADITYSEGIERHWRRKTKYDFYLPTFANLGEQAVMESELYFEGQDFEDEPVFGYQERWAEYRYNPSLITGLFRPNPSGGATSLDVWHLSQNLLDDFSGNPPTLSAGFIQSQTPIERIVAVTDEPEIIFDSYLNIKHTRPLPMYSIPGLRRF